MWRLSVFRRLLWSLAGHGLVPASFGRVGVNVAVDLADKLSNGPVEQRARDAEAHRLPIVCEDTQHALPEWLAAVDGERVCDIDIKEAVCDDRVGGEGEFLHFHRLIPAQQPPAGNNHRAVVEDAVGVDNEGGPDHQRADERQQHGYATQAQQEADEYSDHDPPEYIRDDCERPEAAAHKERESRNDRE